MHTYATDTTERERVPLIIGALAVGLSWSAKLALSYCNLNLPWWSEAPTPIALFGVIYGCYDQWVWRWHAGGFAFSKLPNLNGTWVGVVRSTYNVETRTPVVLHVQQNWLKIRFELEADYSKSCSTMAAVKIEESHRPSVSYAYLNEPKTLAEFSMHSHRGFAQLALGGDGKSLDGDYFTGRDRYNIGTMTMKLVSRQMLDRTKAFSKAPEPCKRATRAQSAGESE